MNKDFSIIDANLARAKEALRILEDIARFSLRDQVLFVELRGIRHMLKTVERLFGAGRVVYSRFDRVLGRGEVIRGAYERSSIWDIIRANASRITEAFRVLEEFSKIYVRSHAEVFESERYKLYGIEQRLLSATPHFWLRTYFESGVVISKSDSVEELQSLIRHGARMVLLFDRHSPRRTVYEKIKQLCGFIDEWNRAYRHERVLCLLNDHIEVALATAVDGVHISRDIRTVAHIRTILGSEKIIGHTRQTLDEIKQSMRAQVDYIAVGPVFDNIETKKASLVSLDTIPSIVETCTIPLCATGGITPKNAEPVYQSGIKNIMVMTAAGEFFYR